MKLDSRLVIFLIIYAIVGIITIFLIGDTLPYVLALLIMLGLAIFIVSFITSKVVTLKESVKSRIFSIVLIHLVFYFLSFFFAGVPEFQSSKLTGITFLFLVGYFYSFVFVISLVVGIIRAVKIKNPRLGYSLRKFNMVFLGFLIVLLLINFNYSIISTSAKISGSYNLCSLAPSFVENSLIFNDQYKDRCIVSVAISEKNPEICKESELLRVGCIRRMAVNNEDISFCNSAKDDYERQACISAVVIRIEFDRSLTGITSEFCDDLVEEQSKQDCLKTLAFELSDESFCLEVDDFNNCYGQLANVINNGDESQCDALISSVAKDRCKRWVHSVTVQGQTSLIPTEG